MSLQAVKFFRCVTDGNTTANVIIPDKLVDKISCSDVLDLPTAVSMGINPTQKVNTDGTVSAWKTEEEFLAIRRMNALSQNDYLVDPDNEGKIRLPTMETLVEHAANGNQLVRIYEAESVYKQNLPGEDAPFQQSEMLITEIPYVSPVKNRAEGIPNSLECLPDTILSTPANGIYVPAKADNSEYEMTRGSGSKRFPSSELADQVVKKCKMRSYKGTLYYFDEAEGMYFPLSGEQRYHLVDMVVGQEIREANVSFAYDEIDKYLRYDSRIIVDEAYVPSEKYWAFRDVLLEIESRTVLKNDGRYFVTAALTCSYQPGAVCPLFDQFLYVVSGGDDNLLQLIWEVIGYILSPDTHAKSFFAFIGPKDTGKSLLANILTKLYPQTALSFLGTSDFSGRFDVKEIMGKRLNLCMDLPDIALSEAAVGKIKSLTGGDMVRSDVKYKESVSFHNTAKLLFGSNSMIRTSVPDRAFQDRLVVIPFNFPIPKHAQDKNLERKLEPELPGIAVKALEAYENLRKRNYMFTEIEVPANLERRYDFDRIIRDYAKQQLVFDKDARISTELLYREFMAFCQKLNLPCCEKNEFSRRFNICFESDVVKKKMKFNNEALQGYEGVQIRGNYMH